MPQTVFKYPLPMQDDFTLELPEGAEPLSVQVQRGQPCLWTLVDPSRSLQTRSFHMAGTGHPINNPDRLRFIDTFQIEGGMLVFHVFEVLNLPKSGDHAETR